MSDTQAAPGAPFFPARGRADSPEALVARVQQALEDDGAYVSGAGREFVDASDLAAIAAASDASDQPIYVVVRQYEQDDAFNGNAGDLLARVHDASGEPGIYLANDFGLDGSAVSVEVRQWQDLDRPGGPVAAVDANDAYVVGQAAAPGDLGAQLVVVAEAIADGTLAETADTITSAEFDTTGSGGDDTAAWVAGGTVILVLVLGVAALARTMARRRSGRAPRTFTLPLEVGERVRTADQVNLRRTADQEVLELGEAIDAATMTSGVGQDAWQEALDHYAEARRLLDRRSGGDDEGASTDREHLDDVGAVVLASRGQDALSAALVGRTWSPSRPCLLHPLHGEATTTDHLDVRGQQVTAPLCRACHQALARGRRPALLAAHDAGGTRSYLETDVEPWARTGYGALDPGLITALRRRR